MKSKEALQKAHKHTSGEYPSISIEDIIIELLCDIRDTQTAEHYYGLYCPYHNVWFRQSTGMLFHYPAMEIAQAEIDETNFYGKRGHLWEATQFGKQIPIDVSKIEVGGKMCAG